jgi:hypothetical protein
MAGMAVVTYTWVCEEKDGTVHTSPGVQRKRLGRKRYGRKPSCPALPAIFSELKRLNKNGVLAGQLNLSCVILGGHALGGTMALLNANRDLFPAVSGAFSYAGHTLADPNEGWDKNAVLPLAPDMPLLLIGGTADSVIDSDTRHLSGKNASPCWAMEHSFDHGINGKRGDRYLVVLEGASHYTFATPRDETTGRYFLDRRTRGRGKPFRKYLAQLIVTFCDRVCCGDPMSAADLDAMCDSEHALVHRAGKK